MNLSQMIYRRKSTRKFETKPVDASTIQKIRDFYNSSKPLYPDIKIQVEIVDKKSVKCILPWITPQLITIYSEDKEGMLENVGFIFQQLDLYMQSLGLGVCWLGMGRVSSHDISIHQGNNLKFVIMLAFGYPKGEALRSDISEFRRRPLSVISDISDDKLEPARLAPSSVNSQPWYFTHEGNVIHTYCVHQRLFKTKILSDMNLIDIGICLAHMYISNPNTFRFYKTDKPADVKGYGYIGSFTV